MNEFLSAPEVSRPVTIAVTGTHSTGKTTFLSRLAHNLRTAGIDVATVSDLGEHAQRIGLPILSGHTWASTLWIITRGISNELAAWIHADVVLIDRAVPDALAYYLAALEYRGNQPNPERLRVLEDLITAHSTHYDLIYRTSLAGHLPLGTNKPRDTDLRFRKLADEHVSRVLRDLRIAHQILTVDSHDRALAEAESFVHRRLAIANPPTMTRHVAVQAITEDSHSASRTSP
ncbi:AAA family ATPase [Nocardia xishanensis]|uniref:AAA family ATPase n=1 Tax=Nocardia xishanensis TaxID=238964 RepID=UPI003403358E